MKNSFIIAAFLLVSVVSCSKDKNNSNTACSCSSSNQLCATIVKVAANCDNFGIEVKGVQFAASDIPAQFQVVGTKVCVAYTDYEDLRLCPCCGGTWADIISMSLAN